MSNESSPDRPQPLRLVAQQLKGWIDRLGWIWVEGQLIEINRRAGSRTVFLTLRDRLADTSASIVTSPDILDQAGPLTEGAQVVMHLKASYYTPSGRLSFHCQEIRPVGEGRLLAQLEQRRRMLQAEGLFDRARKKPLPFLPTAIGLVCAADSAAEADVLSNARRRWPAVRIVTRHARVQGENAALEVAAAVTALDRSGEVEVIVIARGGGSVEDLLPFSDEALIRAVADCRTPVVSAIGHESDSPILDLVADLRASTPTDAAKSVVPDVTEERLRVEQAAHRIDTAIRRRLDTAQQRLEELRARPVLRDPLAGFTVHRDQLQSWEQRLDRSIGQILRAERSTLEHTLARVRALSPRATLRRGYAILADADGATLTSVAQATTGQQVRAALIDGELQLQTIAVQPHTREKGETDERS